MPHRISTPKKTLKKRGGKRDHVLSPLLPKTFSPFFVAIRRDEVELPSRGTLLLPLGAFRLRDVIIGGSDDTDRYGILRSCRHLPRRAKPRSS